MMMFNMKGLRAATAWLVLTLPLGACGGPDSWSDVPAGTEASSKPAPMEPKTVGGGLAGAMLSEAGWQRTIDTVRPATFKVLNHGCSFEASGSAVAISPTVLLTNRHVVAGARTLVAQTLHGNATRVESWVVSEQDDLALLNLASPVASPPVPLATDPIPGDLVVALGYPLGGSLTAGKGRVVGVGEVPGSSGTMITASMDILPGNSGGPLVNTDGKLVGLIRAIDLVEGWAIAVPVDRVEDLLDEEHAEAGRPCQK
jgi:S1-C subfamily serine protease